MSNQITLHYFNNLSYLLTKVPDDILQKIRTEVERIRLNFTEAQAHNDRLVGNLQYEFVLDTIPDFENYILSLVTKYESKMNYLSDINMMTNNVPLYVEQPWVNFMKKHEFNPPHSHGGVFSYVIWIDIPYDIEDEKSMPSSVNARQNVPGHFQFIHTNILGDLCITSLPVDKNWNGTLCLFPARLMHSVNPFSTTDEYRITVAGNVSLNTKDIEQKEEND